MSEIDRTIDGFAKTIGEVLQGKKYSIDYYQREYKWEAKQMAELVADLTTKFLSIYDPKHSRTEVGKYPSYFLGSIIISKKGDHPFIVDGQQRLTSLTLLLTYLRRLQQGRDDAVKIDDLIYSERYGEKSFNLEVRDRRACMEALFESGDYDVPEGAAESVYTLVARFEELSGLFPDELRDDALPFFIDWLKERVQIVQITAYTDDDAYAIFETMNDRGLKLTSEDMLKGYLLANIEEGERRTKANELWRARIRSLNELTEHGGSDFLKTWLRSQFSTKIRERKKDARPEDWDRIGTEFHRWLRGAHERIGLNSPDDYFGFVSQDLEFYGRQFQRIVEASSGYARPTDPLRFIAFNADRRFTLQDQVLLAPLRVGDSPELVDKKFEIVGRFLDIIIAWRVWNLRATDYSTMQYAMFTVMRDIRGLDPAPLAQHLHNYLLQVGETFDSRDDTFMHMQNRKQWHNLLARLTDYVTLAAGGTSNYDELTNQDSVRYEVEHIWADHAELHDEEFDHPNDFKNHRNRIGGLLLLPKQFNASYGDDPYEVKLPHYFGQNILAASLNQLSYEKSPGFNRFVKESGLPFKPYEHFLAADIVERGMLYREIAKRVWNPDDLLSVAEPHE